VRFFGSFAVFFVVFLGSSAVFFGSSAVFLSVAGTFESVNLVSAFFGGILVCCLIDLFYVSNILLRVFIF
jgi:hypothetical protein